MLSSHDSLRLSDIILRPWQISSLQLEHEEQEQRICQYEEDLVQAREELLALQEESRRLQEKVQAAQEQLTPLQESVRDSFTQVAQVGFHRSQFCILTMSEPQVNFLLISASYEKTFCVLFGFLHLFVVRTSASVCSQVQQKLNDLQEEERSVTAQLSWKRALEDSSPVMVNGSAAPTAELHQGDPFQQDLFQEDQFKELKVEEPAAELNEHPDQKEEGVNKTQEEEETEEESSKTVEEQKPKPDALDDLYTSLASSEMYSNGSTLTKPQENIVKVINKLVLVISHWMLVSCLNPHQSGMTCRL